jgi:branched-chain amino acid transport system substrate-binding protein
VFPWVFNFPATYWSQATALVQYIADQEGGLDALKGKKIYLVYHNSAYGKEPLRTLEAMAEKFGYEFRGLPVDHPGQEQKATWLQIRKEKPDWVLMWGWGVMNQVAIKEAASIRYPMDHFIGVWWSGSENDVMPAGDAADGYLSGAFHAGGGGFPAHDDIRKYVYDKGLGKGDRDRIGEVLYNRGMVGAMWTTEAIRKAMEIHGTTEVTGKHVRDGFEALDVDEARLEELGLGGFTYPVKITCENHEGPGKVAVQQWDAKAKQWNIVSKFYEPLRDVTGPLIEADSAAYAAENNVTPRDC